MFDSLGKGVPTAEATCCALPGLAHQALGQRDHQQEGHWRQAEDDIQHRAGGAAPWRLSRRAVACEEGAGAATVAAAERLRHGRRAAQRPWST